MCAFLILCVVLAISATYELIEWAAAVVLDQGAEAFLSMLAMRNESFHFREIEFKIYFTKLLKVY